MPIKILRREPMKGEELDVSVDVPSANRQKFDADPEAYLHAALEAAGQKVNGVFIAPTARDSLLKGAGGPRPMEFVVVHVESPKSKSASRHIVIKL